MRSLLAWRAKHGQHAGLGRFAGRRLPTEIRSNLFRPYCVQAEFDWQKLLASAKFLKVARLHTAARLQLTSCLRLPRCTRRVHTYIALHGAHLRSRRTTTLHTHRDLPPRTTQPTSHPRSKTLARSTGPLLASSPSSSAACICCVCFLCRRAHCVAAA
jgi:hypothetical protein